MMVYVFDCGNFSSNQPELKMVMRKAGISRDGYIAANQPTL